VIESEAAEDNEILSSTFFFPDSDIFE